jgi:hypothetical protein
MGGHADREYGPEPEPDPEVAGGTDPMPSMDEASDALDLFSAPGWYTIDYARNVQAFWDGTMWSRTRRWRGVGWFEDEPASLLAPIASLEVVSRYLPASVVSTVGGPPSRPPSLVRMRPEPLPTPPVVPRLNGMAVASLVLSVLGLVGVGSVLGIILGFRARREIRWSRGSQRGNQLAVSGIIVGFCTLALFLVALGFGVFALGTLTARVSSAADGASAGLLSVPAQLASQATQVDNLQCQADLRSVDIALTAYRVDKGAYPMPPKAWSAANYRANYARLTSGVDGGPWLSGAPGTGSFVVEYDSAGNVWVAPPGTYEASYDPSQGLDADPDACHVAVR